MRPSSNRHVIALLRAVLGVNQTDFARLADVSASAIQAIELGRLKLSERLAAKIHDETGVSMGWLLANELSKAPLDGLGKPYTKQVYDEWQIRKMKRVTQISEIDEPSYIIGFYETARRTLATARENGKQELAFYRLAMLMHEFTEEFAPTGQPRTLGTYSSQSFDLVDADVKLSKRLLRFRHEQFARAIEKAQLTEAELAAGNDPKALARIKLPDTSDSPTERKILNDLRENLKVEDGPVTKVAAFFPL